MFRAEAGLMLGAFGALGATPVHADVQTVFLGPSVGDVFQGVDVGYGSDFRIDADGNGVSDLTIRNQIDTVLVYDANGRSGLVDSGSVRFDSVTGVGLPVSAGTTIDSSRVANLDWQTLATWSYRNDLRPSGTMDKGGGSSDWITVTTRSFSGTLGEHLLVPFSIASGQAVGGLAFGWVDMDIRVSPVTRLSAFESFLFDVHVHSVSYDPSGKTVLADRTYQALPFDDPDPLTPVLVPVVPGVPEPASIYLLAAGAAGLAAYRARRKPA